MEEERWCTMPELCKYFGVCNDTVTFWIKSRNLPAEKLGYYWRFKWSDVEKWCRSENAANTKAYRGSSLHTVGQPKSEPVIRQVISYKPLFKKLVDLEMKKKDLAEAAGISIATITKMGRMGSHVNTDVLERICLALHCKIDDILEIVQVNETELLMDAAETEEETVALDPAACEEYGLTQTEQEIVHFVHEQLQYYRDNPPQYMIDQVRRDGGVASIEDAKRNIPTDRFYSLVLNDVIEKWGYEGIQFNKKQIPFKMIESGYFEAEEQAFGEMKME